MAFFGGTDSFSRSYNTTLTGNPSTPPMPSSRSPRSSGDDSYSSSRTSSDPQDSVTLSDDAYGSERTTPTTESEIKMRKMAQDMQMQIVNAQLENFKRQFGK